MKVTNYMPVYVATSLPKSIIAKPEPWMHAILRNNFGHYSVIIFIWDTREIIDVIKLQDKPDTSKWQKAIDNRKDLVDKMHLLSHQANASNAANASNNKLDKSTTDALIKYINTEAFSDGIGNYSQYPYEVDSITADGDTVVVKAYGKAYGDSTTYTDTYEYDGGKPYSYINYHGIQVSGRRVMDINQRVANYILSKLRGKGNFTKVKIIRDLD